LARAYQPVCEHGSMIASFAASDAKHETTTMGFPFCLFAPNLLIIFMEKQILS
jgi:hypothetical protein